MFNTIQNKTVLIVGASSGIGRSVARQLSKHNNRLILCARHLAPLETLVNEMNAHGICAHAIACDATQPQQVDNAMKQALSLVDSIDIALLNVGQGPSIDMSNTTTTQVTQNMTINYHSMVNFLIPLTTLFKQQGYGLVAHTNSLASFLPLPKQGPYCAAKVACRMLIDCCRLELSPYGLTFVSIYPGFVATDRVLSDNSDLPSPFLISQELAAKHVINALYKEQSNYVFPFVTSSLVKLALLMPNAWRNAILKRWF